MNRAACRLMLRERSHRAKNCWPIAVVALLAVLTAMSSATAAQVALSIVLDPAVPGCDGCILSGPGVYDLYASDSAGDNFGIAAYAIPIQNVSTLRHRSPVINFVDDGTGTGNGYPAGFSLLRTANNQTPSGTGYLFGASQDTVTPTPFLIRGYGQSSGSFAAALPAGSQTTIVF